MTVEELKKLANGETITVLNGKGKILIDFENNYFLALLEDDFLLDCYDTFEEALKEIEDWEEK